MSNIHYTKKLTQRITHKLIHAYTPLSYNYNYQLCIPRIIRAYYQNKLKHIQNLDLSIHIQVSYNPHDKKVNLHYIDYKYTTSCTPIISQLSYKVFIITLLYLHGPDLLLTILSNYPSCNPMSSNLIFING